MYVSSLREEEEEEEESIVKSDVFRIMSKMFKPKEKILHIIHHATHTHKKTHKRTQPIQREIHLVVRRYTVLSTKQLTYLVQMFCTL